MPSRRDAGTPCVAVEGQEAIESGVPTHCGCIGIFFGCPAPTSSPGGIDTSISVSGTTTDGLTNGAGFTCDGVDYSAAYCCTTANEGSASERAPCFVSLECASPLVCSSGCSGTESTAQVCNLGVCQ